MMTSLRAVLILFGSVVCVVSARAADTPGTLAREAEILVSQGNIDSAIRMYQRAIRLRRETSTGVDFEATSEKVAQEAKEHGQLQLKRLLADRPELREYHEDHEFKRVEEWIVDHFAGLGSDCLVEWDNRQPYYGDSGLIAEHTIPTSTRKASIRIAKLYPQGGQGTFRGIEVKPGTAIAPEAVLSSLVFELLNVSNHQAFNRITRLAREGELSRSEYVTEMFHAEFRAIHQLQEFYATIYLPWVSRANAKTNPVFWYASSSNGEWEMAETILDRYAFTAWYPWGLFSEAFDGIRQSDGALPRKPRIQCNCATSRVTDNPLKSFERPTE